MNFVNIAKEIILDILDGDTYTIFLFGSRAEGTAKKYSDMDVGVIGNDPLPLHKFSEISYAIEDSVVPFEVDIVDFSQISDTFKKLALQNIIIWNRKTDIQGLEMIT